MTVGHARALARLFARGFAIVALVALQTRFIAGLDYAGAFVTSIAIQLTWWGNSQRAAHSEVIGAKWAYALGGACGVVFGMWIGR